MEGANSSDLCIRVNPNLSCPPLSGEEARSVESMCVAVAVQAYILFSAALVLGLPGSVFTLLTISRLPRKPSTLYIGFLAASDFASLVFASLTFYDLSQPGSANLNHTEQFVKWFGRIFQTFSHWLLVLICTERFVSVRYPLQKARLYTMRNTLFTCLAALALSCAFFILFCIEFYGVCKLREFRFFYIMFYLATYIVLPMVLIVIITSLTAF